MNWTFNDVVKFLKGRKFYFSYAHGSHHYYVGSYQNIIRQVCVPFHANKSIRPKTIKSIILQSGISQKEWEG
jgi:predicted RNA binding protein YcfA (HicA-like mRNA interferase family)